MGERSERIVGAVVGFGLLLAILVLSLNDTPAVASVLAVPLAQATATVTPTATQTYFPTPTNTFTPTATLTPTSTPAAQVASFGGVPICSTSNSDGTYRLCVDTGARYTTPVVSIATVGATPNTTPVLAANPSRIYAICTNDSAATVIYLAPGAPLSVGSGIRLNAAGASYTFTSASGTLYTGPVYAVATQTTSSLTCVDGSR